MFWYHSHRIQICDIHQPTIKVQKTRLGIRFSVSVHVDFHTLAALELLYMGIHSLGEFQVLAPSREIFSPIRIPSRNTLDELTSPSSLLKLEALNRLATPRSPEPHSIIGNVQISLVMEHEPSARIILICEIATFIFFQSENISNRSRRIQEFVCRGLITMSGTFDSFDSLKPLFLFLNPLFLFRNNTSTSDSSLIFLTRNLGL
mmetsp:Transcript_29027/g.40805  ORF Transcript_29027/g.40805 Transcript_29027/m.40805 type:complete len:204 (-) Transcript_29027:205-816(-)